MFSRLGSKISDLFCLLLFSHFHDCDKDRRPNYGSNTLPRRSHPRGSEDGGRDSHWPPRDDQRSLSRHNSRTSHSPDFARERISESSSFARKDEGKIFGESESVPHETGHEIKNVTSTFLI